MRGDRGSDGRSSSRRAACLDAAFRRELEAAASGTSHPGRSLPVRMAAIVLLTIPVHLATPAALVGAAWVARDGAPPLSFFFAVALVLGAIGSWPGSRLARRAGRDLPARRRPGHVPAPGPGVPAARSSSTAAPRDHLRGHGSGVLDTVAPPARAVGRCAAVGLPVRPGAGGGDRPRDLARGAARAATRTAERARRDHPGGVAADHRRAAVAPDRRRGRRTPVPDHGHEGPAGPGALDRRRVVAVVAAAAGARHRTRRAACGPRRGRGGRDRRGARGVGPLPRCRHVGDGAVAGAEPARRPGRHAAVGGGLRAGPEAGGSTPGLGGDRPARRRGAPGDRPAAGAAVPGLRPRGGPAVWSGRRCGRATPSWPTASPRHCARPPTGSATTPRVGTPAFTRPRRSVGTWRHRTR